jgi:hypothetical protein
LHRFDGSGPTENLLQLHNAGIGADTVDCLCLLKVLALLKDLAVGAMFTVRVGHDCVVSLVFAELEVMLSSKLRGPGAGPRPRPCQATSYAMLRWSLG